MNPLKRCLRKLSGWNEPSVWFFTFHKCASSLFSAFALREVANLSNIDYEQRLVSGKVGKDEAEKITFRDKGYVYGPIRLSASRGVPVAEVIFSSAQEDFLKERKAVFLPRDPRDIIVSAYLSFTGAHEDSKVDYFAERQKANRKHLEQMSIDEYAHLTIDTVVQNFLLMDRLIQACGDPVVVSYEEMIDDFAVFSEKLSTHLRFSPAVLEEIHKRTRPREREDLSSHKRLGKVGGYKEKLKPETVEMLNSKLEEVLPLFGYR